MQQLEYEARTTPSSSWGVAALIALPLLASLLLFYVAWTNALEEPYGVFNWSDAVVQVGGSGVVALLWLARLAVARWKRVRWFVLLPICLWGVLNLLTAYMFGVGYFDEIWNQP